MISSVSCRLLSANPLVAIADAFLDEGACQTLMELARPGLERAKVGTDARELEVSADRTNTDCALPPDRYRDVNALMEQLAACVGLPPSHGEGLSVLRYGPGDAFADHVDGISSEASAEAQAAFDADGGQRLFTTMIYLNEVEAGGATTFPALGLRIPPKPGRLLMFANTAAGSGDASPRAIHAGEEVTAGEKWAAVCWWRVRPFGRPSPHGS